MSFNSAKFAAGVYDCVLGPNASSGSATVSLGLMRGDQDSPMVEVIKKTALINRTHKFGNTPIGAIIQGGEAFFNATLEEYLPAVLALLWPFPIPSTATQAAANAALVVPSVAVDDYDASGAALVLTLQSTTQMAGTSGNATGPATMTLTKAALAEDYPLKFLMGPVHREIPIRMRLFPTIASSIPIFGTVT